MQYTGSQYYGEYVHGRMQGRCEYEFPVLLGSTYEGEMKDGDFNGDGKMYLSNSMSYRGKFEGGLSKQGKYVFSDELEYDIGKEWGYCDVKNNRMFAVELQNGLKPAGRCLVSNMIPPRVIPHGMYDSGDGFYDPAKRVLYTYDMRFLRTADDEEHSWIVSKCRKAEPEEPNDSKKN